MSETINNDFYQQWGLAAVAVALIVPALTVVWQLMQMKHTDITSTELKIKSELSRSFQLTVLEEARTIFRLIEENLFTALGEEVRVDPPKTRFGHLVEELRKVPSEDSEKSEHVQIIGALKNALSGVLITQIEKLFDDVKIGIAGKSTWIDALSNPRRIAFAFEETTEKALSALAEELEQVNRRIKWYFRMRNIAVVSFSLVGMVGLIVLPALAISYGWAEWVVLGCIAIVSLGGMLGIFALVRIYFIKRWLEKRASIGDSYENVVQGALEEEQGR